MTIPAASTAPFITFGAGYIYGLNLGSAYSQNAPTLITPGKFITIQDANVDFTFTIKELLGATEFAEDIASASKKLTGKVTTGRIDLNVLNQLVFEDSFVTGQTAIANLEAHSIGVSPTDTVTVTNAASFVQDLGVFYTNITAGNDPVQLQSIGNNPSPAQGQYAVNPATGVYTFNGADAGQAVQISYTYTLTSGHSLTVNNRVMGSGRPVFSMYLSMPYQGTNDLILFYCRAASVKIPIKREDYCILEIDYQCSADNLGRVAEFCSSV